LTWPFRFPPGPFTSSLDYPRYPLGRAIALTAVAGLVGVCTTAIASALGWGFPSFGYLFETVVWKLATIGILAWGLQVFEHRRPTLAVVGYRQSESWPVGEARRRSGKAMVGLGVGFILFVPFSFLGTSAGNPSAYGPVRHASLALVLAQLLVCYPLTVVAEETFFRGWLQPRLGPWGPISSALLWSGYHLEQWRTIPSLIPLGIILGVVCWWTGNVRTSSVLHYLSNAIFFIASYT